MVLNSVFSHKTNNSKVKKQVPQPNELKQIILLFFYLLSVQI